MHCSAASFRSLLVVAFILSVCMGQIESAFGIASWFAQSEGVLQFSGPSADLLVFQDPIEDVVSDNFPPVFPSFVNNAGGLDWDPLNRTLTVTAQANGAANFSGVEDPAFATGITRVAGRIGI